MGIYRVKYFARQALLYLLRYFGYLAQSSQCFLFSFSWVFFLFILWSAQAIRHHRSDICCHSMYWFWLLSLVEQKPNHHHRPERRSQCLTKRNEMRRTAYAMRTHWKGSGSVRNVRVFCMSNGINFIRMEPGEKS